MSDLKDVQAESLAEINRLTAPVKELEENEESNGVFYVALARIELLSQPEGSHDLDSEISEFRRLFSGRPLHGEEEESHVGTEVSGSAPPVGRSSVPDANEGLSAA